MSVVPLTSSAGLVIAPPIVRSEAVRLTPEKYQRWWHFFWLPGKAYSSWEDMFEKNADRLDYLLTPGDYRTLGPLVLKDHPGNTALRPSTIRYYNPGVDDAVHPVRRPAEASSAALVDTFRLDGPTTRDWLVQGLTVSEPTKHTAIRGKAGNITVDFCLIEKDGDHLLRIRDASNCAIQRCVLRDTIQPYNAKGEPLDSIGIQIDSTDADVLAIKILDNEIYNVGDGIQTTPSDFDPTRPVEVLIEGNDIYLEPSRYIPGTDTTLDENAIDLKAGSDSLRPIIIRRNRMWGFRRRAVKGALGEIFVVNKFCRNVVVEKNIMGDAPIGMKDENWPPDSVFGADEPRNIIFRLNQFYEIRDYDADDEGAITKPITSGISFICNYFSRSDFIAAETTQENVYRGEGPHYEGNTRVEVGGIQRSPFLDRVPYTEPTNAVAAALYGYDTYERKRWTGPELATGAVAAEAP